MFNLQIIVRMNIILSNETIALLSQRHNHCIEIYKQENPYTLGNIIYSRILATHKGELYL